MTRQSNKNITNAGVEYNPMGFMNRDSLYVFLHIKNSSNRVSKYPTFPSDNDNVKPFIKNVIKKIYIPYKTKCRHGPRCRCHSGGCARARIERILKHGIILRNKAGFHICDEIGIYEDYISRKDVLICFVEMGYTLDWIWQNGWNYNRMRTYLSNINEDDINTKCYFNFGYFLINAKKKTKVDFSNNPDVNGKRFN